MDITLPETLPSLPAEFVGAWSRMSLRDDLPVGFSSAVQGFEEWCQLLLLDAVQRFGFFLTANEVWNSIGLDICAPSHWRTKLALTQQKEFSGSQERRYGAMFIPDVPPFLGCPVGTAQPPTSQLTALYPRQQDACRSFSVLKYGT